MTHLCPQYRFRRPRCGARSLSGTYQAGAETAARSADQLSATFTQSKKTLTEAMENHPFVGRHRAPCSAVIASALPVSEAENRVSGDTSDDLKKRARDVSQFLPQRLSETPWPRLRNSLAFHALE
jgi:hypothetical protein